MKKLLLCVLFAAALNVRAGGYGSKVIYHGWDVGLATPADVLKHADAFDRLAIDGISLKLRGARDGSTVDAAYAKGQFDDLIPIYRQITAHKSLKESFLICGTMPYARGVRYAWTDDAAWARIGANFRELARVAKAGGLKGLMIDNEDYVGSRQFRHVPEADGDWETATRRVRARGRDFFRGIFAEYPDVTLLFFWAYIDNEYAHLSATPRETLRASGRLTCAFLDGMLDVMPPTARFVEGNENAYAYEAFRGDFDRHAVEVLSDMVKVVAPENRAKYRAHVRNGYGLYLDEFVNDPIRRRKGQPDRPNHWYRGPRNGSRAEHFREIVEGALRAADEYVWVYGEKFAAVDWGDTLDQGQWSLKFDQRRTWDEAIGLSPKLALARGGAAYAAKRVAEIRAAGGERNLLPDAANFTRSADGTNAVTTSFFYADMTNRVPYALEVFTKGDVRVAAYWLRDGMWCLDVPPEWFVVAEPVGAPEADGWQRRTALVRGPADVDALDVQFTVRSGTGAFRNAALLRFETDAPAGRFAPEASGSAARVRADPVLKAALDRHPDCWRVDGDVLVIQKSVSLFHAMVEKGRSRRPCGSR